MLREGLSLWWLLLLPAVAKGMQDLAAVVPGPGAQAPGLWVTVLAALRHDTLLDRDRTRLSLSGGRFFTTETPGTPRSFDFGAYFFFCFI